MLVLEGFLVQIVTHWICVKYLPHSLVALFQDLPWITVGVVLATVSPLVAMSYMWVRLGRSPLMVTETKIFRGLVIGIILAFLATVGQIVFVGKGDPFTVEILQTQSRPAYFYFTLFFVVIWGPLLEEVLNRAYFFETLRISWGSAVALLLSSFLFVSFHGIFITMFYGGIGYEMVFTALYSIIFTVVYMRGGLIAAFLTHMFVNSCLLWLNTEIGV